MPKRSKGRRAQNVARAQQQKQQEDQEELELEQQLQQFHTSTPAHSSGSGSNDLFHEDLASDLGELSNPDAVINGIRFGLAKISKLAEETIPNTSDDMKCDVARRLEACMLKLIKAETMYSKAASIVTEMVESMPEEPNADAAAILKSCEQISEVSKERINDFSESLTDDDLKLNKTYKRFVGKVNILLGDESNVVDENVERAENAEKGNDEQGDDQEGQEQSGSNGEDDEEEETETEQSPQGVEQEEPESPDAEAVEEEESEEEELLPTVDPITREELKDPVRNQKCGHIYGKAAMTQLIKKNSKTRCPIAGCSNKAFIKLNQLVADRKLTMEIRKKQAEEKKQNRKR